MGERGIVGAAEREVLIGRSIYERVAPASCEPVRRTVAQALQGDMPVPTLNERIALQMVITDITERAQESRDIERRRIATVQPRPLSARTGAAQSGPSPAAWARAAASSASMTSSSST